MLEALLRPLERIMKEIWRRTRVVGAFPDGQSCLNLAAAQLRHIARTTWLAKCYMNMRPLYQQHLSETESRRMMNVRKSLDTHPFAARAFGAISEGRSVMIHTARGADNPRIGAMRDAITSAGHSAEDAMLISGRLLANRPGLITQTIVSQSTPAATPPAR